MGNYETCQTDNPSEWNGAAANELCGKKGIWREDMGWERRMSRPAAN